MDHAPAEDDPSQASLSDVFSFFEKPIEYAPMGLRPNRGLNPGLRRDRAVY